MKAKSFLLSTVSLMTLVSFSQAQAQVSFFQPPTFMGNGTVFVADFNGDGKPDILTSDGTMNLGTGDGTFKQGTSLSNTSGPILAVADFNGDGKPDVLEQGTGTLLVLLGNGDGTFQAAISTASGASLSPVAAVDLNADHKADVVGVFNSSLYVYISNGDGTFRAGVPYSLGSNTSVVLSFGDFNSDQKIDIALSTLGQEIVMLGNGDGTFQQTTKTSTGVGNPQLAVVGDFNSDGKMDIALEVPISEGSILVPYSQPAIYMLLGNGNGTFQTPVLAMTGAGLLTLPNEVAPLGVADLNGDGKLDIVLSIASIGAQIYLGNGDGTFINTANYQLCLPQSQFPISGVLAVADFNSDGKPDIAGCNAVLLGNGSGTFQGWPVALLSEIPTAAVVGQFDKTGAPDVAVVGNNVYILKNDGSGALSPANTYPLQQSGIEALTADLNGDGNLDLVVIGYDGSNWSYSVLLGNGDGTFQAPVYYPQTNCCAGAGIPPAAVLADFNNDHKPDLAVTGLFNGVLNVFLGNGDGTFASPVSYFDDGFGGPLLVADFNGDGKLDIAAGGEDISSGTVKTLILFGNGDGTFQAAVFPPSLNNFVPSPQFTADVNHDGKPDLISIDQVALGNGDGTFNLLSPLSCPSWIPSTPCWIMAVADLNNDGRPDLLLEQGATGDFQTGMQLGNGDGTFAPAIPFPATGNVPLFSIADMNGDGKPDLIFGWEMHESLAIFVPFTAVGVILNTTTPDFTLGPASGSPTSQTINAGQTASFKLVLGAIESFSGTVNLSCAITPMATPAPTCNLSSSSLQISATTSQMVTVNVGTTASTTTSAGPRMVLPPGAMFSAFMLSGLALLFPRGRRRLPALAMIAMAMALALCISCGGSSQHTTQGTPPGTYSATVTASSGSLTHTMSLQVIVQ